MQLIEKKIELKTKSDVVYIFPLGDTHIGTFNCAEGHIRQYVQYIKNKPNAYWIGGGDYCDFITPSDTRRFDVRSLADWLFVGEAVTIKEALLDIAKQQRERFCEMVEPIKDKCLGLIEGNHEYDIMRTTHNGQHYVMCDELGVPNLTDAAFVRLNFKIKGGCGRSIKIFIVHGWGGGRSTGAEPNHLLRLGQIADADIHLRGHSHTFRIEPPEVHLWIPDSGALPDECYQRVIRKGNWGCWVLGYAVGPSTYDSRRNYQPRPLQAMEISIKPFHNIRYKTCGKVAIQTQPIIKMSECGYEF